ncbi:hypothetical protein [Halobacterium salinarum]|uniref:hypothetical protein n=1 Tax=Halobacterium salinarum TaxID=2242 RepID=UPI001F22448D|nr:hypothetical protein [Halobacterium salinarum]MCF2165425.1 hypothetical protein [Halobacterium salinarum]
MKPIECNTCGDTTYILERNEIQVRELPEGKETPRDHLKRTGHDPRERPGERRECLDCENVWWYQGSADRPTCPECKGKRTQPVEMGSEE